jgi:hypothetical protein
MTVFAKLIVAEDDGIRRFLYPLEVELPFKKNESLEIAVRDAAGNLLPSEAYRSRNKVTVHFAVSLGPYERKKLIIFKSEEKAPVPDPIHSDYLDDGTTVHRQERITTTLLANSELGSVIYDGVEHLAGPVTFLLNDENSEAEVADRSTRGRELTFQSRVKRFYSVGERLSETVTNLTACKSWINVVHTIEAPIPGSVISMQIPLTPPSDDEQPVCDFGLGNGIYSKIDGDAVLLEADFYGKKPYCCWQISRLSEGIQRIDYQGDAVTIKSLSRSLYFHWTLPHRSLAVVITQLPAACAHIQAQLMRNGTIIISAVLGDMPVNKASLGVLLHFLNDVPAIAAATNPASAAGPPVLAIKT